MTCKIIGICGSTRKNATEFALQEALKTAAEYDGVETEFITVRGKTINPCIHCNRCVKEGQTRCLVYEDDMNEIYRKCIEEADGFIYASPVFEMGISPQLAALYSRFRPNYLITKKDPDYFGKKVAGAIAVGGTRNGGQETTINAIHGFFHTGGYIVVGGAMGVYAGASVWSQDAVPFTEEVDPVGIANARRIGKRVAETTLRLNGVEV